MENTDGKIVHFQTSLEPPGEGPALCMKHRIVKGLWVTIDRNLVTCSKCKELLVKRFPSN